MSLSGDSNPGNFQFGAEPLDPTLLSPAPLLSSLPGDRHLNLHLLIQERPAVPRPLPLHPPSPSSESSMASLVLDPEHLWTTLPSGFLSLLCVLPRICPMPCGFYVSALVSSTLYPVSGAHTLPILFLHVALSCSLLPQPWGSLSLPHSPHGNA